MKKTIIIIAALIAGATFSTAGAQEKKVTFGVKMNANLTNVKLSNVQGSKARFNPGASLGGFTRISFTENFSLQPELVFNYTEAKVKCDCDRLKFKYASIEIPVYLQGHVKAGKGQFIFGAGPQIGYGLSTDTRMENVCDEGLGYSDVIELDHWYAGGGVTAGYEFKIGLSVNAGYQMGFDIASRHKSANVKTQTASLGATYRF